jgi:Ni/Fe-hydrogenase 1 B-type cytochrome subunit
MANRGITERVYVWEIPVRLTHWVNVLAILVLSATGFYIGDPVFGGSVYLMAWVRGVHRITAYVFIASLTLRTYWAFAGNEWAKGRELFPYVTREGRRGIVRTFLYYTFLRREPPGAVGHNPLAGLAYSAVVALMLLEVLTGFALQSLGTTGWRSLAFGWVFSLLGPQSVRLVHHMIMWLLLGFMVHHVYSSLLMDAEERSGLMASMFSGYKFVRRRT